MLQAAIQAAQLLLRQEHSALLVLELSRPLRYAFALGPSVSHSGVSALDDTRVHLTYRLAYGIFSIGILVSAY